MTGPEGIRWGLAQAPQSESDWSHPLIGGVELKAVDPEAQKAFYTQVLGMAIERETEQAIHLSQASGEAWLHIESGGVEMPIPAPPGDPKPAFYYPIWISYETEDVRNADAWLQRQGVRILHPLTYHEDWNGTDIIIADADGNAIQIVQYGKIDGI